MSKLFAPIMLGDLMLENRIIIPPMCQFSAKPDGMVTDWYKMHYGALAHSGAGLLVVEATAVHPAGRLTPFDLGLWDDQTRDSMKELVAGLRAYASIPLAIQLGHAGRKASMTPPWEPTRHLSEAEHGWRTVAPSALRFDERYDTPQALSVDGIKAVIDDFTQAAIRADEAGFDVIELHCAHGYLLHEFLSPLSNCRQDEYGGSLENRMRLVLEVFEAVRKVVSAYKPVGVRISATDWVEGGWDLGASLALCTALKMLKCSFIDVSSGGLAAEQQLTPVPNYQVEFAHAVKKETGLPTIAVGLITTAQQAEEILKNEEADMIAIGRAMLFNPHWPWQAACELDGTVQCPSPYLRSAPQNAPGIFKY